MSNKAKLDNSLILNQDSLEFNDPPVLIWIRVRDAVKLLWEENPKLHDIGSVIASIQRHGLQELPKYDAILGKAGVGGIKAGNGRIECLDLMEKDKQYDLPRGLARERETGFWAMPLLIGTDAKSVDLARSYAIDSNNLLMAGGDFTGLDMSRLWDREAYATLLQELANADELPVSVDGDDLDQLLKQIGDDLSGVEFKEYDESVENEVEWLECPKCGHKFPK